MCKGFLRNEAGAVSVEWVVITALIVSIGMATIFLLSDEIEAEGVGVSTAMAAYEIEDAF